MGKSVARSGWDKETHSGPSGAICHSERVKETALWNQRSEREEGRSGDFCIVGFKDARSGH